jgi:hypothetical protein
MEGDGDQGGDNRAIPSESKTPRDQRSRWISVARGAPSELSKSAEVRLTKNDSISITYEFRTKSAQSGGLEKNGRRDGILGLSRHVAVRRFVHEARGYWASMRVRKSAENVGRGRAGGEGGIRTPDTVARIPHFECGAIDHSATSPWSQGQTARSVGRYVSNAAGRNKGWRDGAADRSLERSRRPGSPVFASAMACAHPRGVLRSGRVSPLPGGGLRARDAPGRRSRLPWRGSPPSHGACRAAV